ncbi:MAG: hypothetical protein QOE89_201 [Pseudonocardiales bacterium]|jgi:hypothetical protein|nr:hypothetical protein [Pseudonocardiales bacterium]
MLSLQRAAVAAAVLAVATVSIGMQLHGNGT